MSKLIENVKSVLELVSSNVLVLSSVFILVGFLFLAIGFLELDGTRIISRDSTMYPPVILGIILSGVGLLLFVSQYYTNDTKRANTIVFYSPTIKANSFFMQLLDYSVETTKQKGYSFVIEKGNLEEFHAATNYLDVIRQYSGSKASNTVLIMIPPLPAAYKYIWELPKDLKANLITLDMDIDGQESKFYECPFHMRVILVDNRHGAMLAAKEIVSFCEREGIEAINVIICEGDFHARGHLFKTEIESLARDSGLDITFLGPIEELSFSDAVSKARDYIRYFLHNATEDLRERSTFIFCANDQLAIGTRMAVSNVSPDDLRSFKPIRILSFDASTFVRMYIDQGDYFFWCAVDQRYTEIMRHAIESAEMLFEGQALTKQVIRVKPVIYKRYQD